MEINKVLFLLPISDEKKKQIENEFQEIKFIYKKAYEVDEDLIKDINVIIGNPNSEILKKADNLKWLQLNSSGADKYIKNEVLKDGIILTNATGAYGLAISEHMISVLLSLLKKLNLYRNNQKNHLWKDEGIVKSIYGSKVLIVGLGNIGEEFAKKIKVFGAYTIGVRRSNLNKPDFIDEIHLMEDLDKLIPEADVIALSLPNTKETQNIFSRERLKAMKKDSVLLNVGRGNVLDTEALCDEVENGHLLGAAVDVTDPEPLPKDHRMWDIEQILITPHISGGYHMKETLESIIEISISNLRSIIKDEKLKNIVDFSTGYAKK